MPPDQTVANDPPQTTDGRPALPRLRIALFSIVALAAGTAATVAFEWLRYERFPGFIQARMRTVAATRDAQIAEILVTSGSLVTAGQPLVRLRDAAFEQDLEAKRRQIESLEIELAESQAKLEVELEWRRKNILEKIFEARLKRVQALPSEADLCTQHIEELERINRELPAKISRSMGVDLARARLAHAQSEMSQLESQKSELVLLAETSGLVGVFQKSVGDRVLAHEPIVQLLDEEQPFLVVQIPSPRISDFAPGTVVDLQFPGGQIGKGRVDEIPPQTSPAPMESGRIGESVVTAHVDPMGVLWPSLPFGSTVEVRRLR